MGWTSYHATEYKKGNVDKKAECEKIFTQEENGKYAKLKVLKSVMVGNTFYAAVEASRNNVVEDIFAVVVLTSVNNRDYYNFSYKEMSEECGPCQYDCPKSILDLLTETKSEWAMEWRKKCRERIEKKKNGKNASALPIGAIIKFTLCDKEFTLEKKAPNYQFKRSWWYNASNNTYMPAARIPDNFEIVNA